MQLYFIRHGNPDYENDCLTELGIKQARAAAQRLEREKIDKIYSSPYGRAMQTAEFTAKHIGKEITTLDFMKEINSRQTQRLTGKTAIENGISEDTDEYKYIMSDDISYKCYKYVSAEFDKWLETLGYKRDGNRYLSLFENNDKIALFSHNGASSVVLSHILDLPFMFLCARTTGQDFTAITVVDFKVGNNKIVIPELKLFNDAEHIRDIK